MKRWLLVVGLIVIVAVAGCGGDDGGDANGNGSEDSSQGTRVPTRTPRPPAPRDQLLPDGDPYDFEAPFSVGNYVRESVRGRATLTRTGGMQAVYRSGDNVVTLTIYAFDTPEQAVDTVRFTLDSASITAIIDEPFYTPSVAFGVAQDRHGGYLTVWSHYEWFFMVRTSGDLTVLNEFLGVFPY